MNNKYKVCVYAICKNEEQFVDRWYESMKEADEIYVLDTGSTDNTVNKLKNHGINVTVQEIKPWRFDVARNISLDLVPFDTDICICIDLDEVFEPGWRKKLENIWKNDITRLRYVYNWYIDENNVPKISYYAEKIHSRNNFQWIHPVHEILQYNGNEKMLFTDDIVVNHYPDRSKSRASYLPLLELAVEENPENDRNMHYLGREYMYYGKWNESIDTLIKHLDLKSSVWKPERSASMRFIARCYQNLNRINEAKMWLDKAIAETPDIRDPYVERALLEYNLQNWEEVIKYCNLALKIENHERVYINETFSWDHTIYDLLSIGYFQLKNYEDSFSASNKALEFSPTDKRLIENNNIIKSYLN